MIFCEAERTEGSAARRAGDDVLGEVHFPIQIVELPLSARPTFSINYN